MKKRVYILYPIITIIYVLIMVIAAITNNFVLGLVSCGIVAAMIIWLFIELINI